MARIAQLVVGGQPTAWSSIGLTLVDGISSVGDFNLRFDDSLEPGIASWTLSGCIGDGDIDGILTTHGDLTQPAKPDSTIMDIVGVDHVVVFTNDLERTSREVARVTGEPLKRIREAGDGVRQGFHRLGSVIVEIVEQKRVEQTFLWGFVLNVNNLDEVARHFGPDVLSPPRDAVQPGRRIAAFRGGVGLGTAVALMTPERQ
jgi:hypothetical protein